MKRILAGWIGRAAVAALLASAVFAGSGADPVGAWNGETYTPASQACGPYSWCGVKFDVWGGPDQWDYIRIEYYSWCYGYWSTQAREMGLNNGSYLVGFWNGAGCTSSYAAIFYYDLVNNAHLWPIY